MGAEGRLSTPPNSGYPRVPIKLGAVHGRAYAVFGADLEPLLDELNEVLAA
jgi:hypothetical protein